MTNCEKTYNKIMRHGKVTSFPFREVRSMLESMGAKKRIEGDHFLFTFSGCGDIINLQPEKGEVKLYQVRQIRKFFIKYGL